MEDLDDNVAGHSVCLSFTLAFLCHNVCLQISCINRPDRQGPRARSQTAASMILAFLTFGFALTQVFIERDVISPQKKFEFAIVVTSLSAIPLAFQCVILLGELARARNYSAKLLVHRMVMDVLGSSGASSNLILKQYRQKKIGTYVDARGGLWKGLLYVGHSFAKLFGAISFGDAFSGNFAVRHTSVALWIEDERAPWVDSQRPDVDDDLFSRHRLKVVRDLSLTVEFQPLEQGQVKATEFVINSSKEELSTWEANFNPTDLEEERSTMVHFDVIATGSRDNHVSKLYTECWYGHCSIASALELCTLMETLNNDTFLVSCRPPEENDQTLSCEELQDVLRLILFENKRLIAKRVYGMSYV